MHHQTVEAPGEASSEAQDGLLVCGQPEVQVSGQVCRMGTRPLGAELPFPLQLLDTLRVEFRPQAHFLEAALSQPEQRFVSLDVPVEEGDEVG